jgi:hypothetical protein
MMMETKGKKNGAAPPSSFVKNIQSISAKVFNRKCLQVAFILFGMASVLLSYYLWMQQKYLVDEIYELNGPNELKVDNQFTIRVYAPKTIEELEEFILQHSICPIVYEIQILWHSSSHDSPPIESFPYSTAHSKVSYQYFHSHENIFESYFDVSTVKTAGTALLNSLTSAFYQLLFSYSDAIFGRGRNCLLR